MVEAVLLIQDDGTRREVLATLKSVSRSEFYQAQASGYRPELVFVLTDYLDYDNETWVNHDGQIYKVLRTYRAGQEIELVVTAASAEEVELYG